MDTIEVGTEIKVGNITLTVTGFELRALLPGDEPNDWYTVVQYTRYDAATGETTEGDNTAVNFLTTLKKHGVI